MDTGRQMTLASAFSPLWPKGGENEEKGGERFLPRVGGLKTRGRIGSPAPLSLYMDTRSSPPFMKGGLLV